MTMSMTEYDHRLYSNIVNPAALLAGKGLGLFRALEKEGGLSPEDLAAQTRLPHWIVGRWLDHQVGLGNVRHDDLTGDYFLSASQQALNLP